MLAIRVEMVGGVQVLVAGVGRCVPGAEDVAHIGEDIDTLDVEGELLCKIGIDNIVWNAGVGEGGGQVEGHASPEGAGAGLEDEQDIGR